MAEAQGQFSRTIDNAANLTWFIMNLFLALWLASLRSQLRQKLGGRTSFFEDFCCYWWCLCCVSIQDARQVDGATGTKTECCLKLVTPPVQQAWAPAVPTVVGTVITGQPVVVSTSQQQQQTYTNVR